ncbi:HNH endonuclease [Alteromonas australica]|uniref:HNH endonuclease n=1 Tax=Alteromonas australica TaxID=589873 RepID=UPI0035C80EBC
MIKLNRNFTPLYLSPENSARLREAFKSSGKAVWAHTEVKTALLELSSYKCAYCECKLAEESKYMEVEHFHDKASYPSMVIEWDNLLPSCKRCNVSKSTHDVKEEPIINPFINNPKDHIEFHLYRLRGTSDIGIATEEVLDLNNFEKVLQKRFDIGNSIQDSLKDIIEKVQLYEKNQSVRRRNKLIGSLKGLLDECVPEASYSAASATVLHNDPNYLTIVRDLKALNIWTKDLQVLHDNSLSCALQYA